MKDEVLSLATFTLGALCFVTFLVMVKPMSFGVEESSSLFSYAATQNKRQIASSKRNIVLHVLDVMPHPTRFERVTFAFGDGANHTSNGHHQ